jgi:putative ABC transport system permease protein
MIEVGETVALATRSLWRNKARSSLTMLGIIIGVSAVILLISVGQGLQNYITGQFESLGTNQVYIIAGAGLEGFGQGPPNFAGSKLTLKHVDEIAKLGSPIKTAAADSDIPAPVKYKGESKVTTVAGISSEWVKMVNIEIANGRTLSKSDVDLARNITILGQTIVEDFFGKSNPVGQYISIGDEKFKVVGVIEEIGTQSIGFDIDNFVIIPITTSQRVFGIDSIQSIIVQAETKEDIAEVIDKAERYMLTQMDEDDFSIIDQSSLLETISNILNVLTAALGGIAAISLVVGGVGIMNIMLVTVTERTREIGLRKAVGAKPSDILSQFLIEAVTLSVAGGAVGIAIGWMGSMALNRFFPAQVTAWSVGLAFGVSAAVGIIFGVAPAIRASRLNPIEALRYE